MENKIIYEILLQNVGKVLKKGRESIIAAIKAANVKTYWEIGKNIIEYEQKGNEKAEYGSDLLNRLSKDLTARYGNGFSRSNVFYIRKLYITYKKVQTLSELLSFSHYIELLKINNETERTFYEAECINGHWGVKELT